MNIDIKQPIHIVCATDNLYAMMVCALVKSIEDNHKTGEPLVFHIIDNGIKRSNKRHIVGAISADISQVNWIKISAETYQNMHPNADQIDLSTHYARFLIPHILDHSIKKVIYIDCDTIVLGEISNLWHTDLAGNVLAAAQDNTATIGDHWLIENHEALGLSATEKYFNSGVLVLDLERWRAKSITQKLIQCTVDNLKQLKFYDQYAFNVVFHKQWTVLSPSWNHMQVKPIQKDIDLVHYVAWDKPILKTSTGIYHPFFYTYIDKATHGKWRPYTQLHQIEQITRPEDLPVLLERLGLVYHPDFGKNHQGVVMESNTGKITAHLLENEKNLHLYRLILIKMDDNYQTDLEDVHRHIAQETFKIVQSAMAKYAHRIAVIQKSAVAIISSLAQQSYSFVFIDMGLSMQVQHKHIGLLLKLVHFGGLMCGVCTQEVPLEKKDFDFFKFYDQNFNWESKAIQIHQSPTHSNQWFWYFIREY